MAQRPNYVPIPGSDVLATKARGDSAAAAVEAAAPASLARVEVVVAGRCVVVGPAMIQGRSVPLLLEVMDRVGPLLSPESFVVYLQLYRLALADGRNACRVSLGELSRRTGLRDRRLGKAVADLVAADHVVLIDRTRDGTLYRVRLPDEPEGAAVVSAAPKTAAPKTAAPKTAPSKTAPPKTAPSLSSTPHSVGDVCTWFATQFAAGPGRSGSDVAAIVMELLESGWTFARIPPLLERFIKTSPKTTPLRDLQRVLRLEEP